MVLISPLLSFGHCFGGRAPHEVGDVELDAEAHVGRAEELRRLLRERARAALEQHRAEADAGIRQQVNRAADEDRGQALPPAEPLAWAIGRRRQAEPELERERSLDVLLEAMTPERLIDPVGGEVDLRGQVTDAEGLRREGRRRTRRPA